MDENPEEPYDAVVVGGGMSGIAAARTYLEFLPTARLLILEADSCVGGIWSKGIQYRALSAQVSLILTMW